MNQLPRLAPRKAEPWAGQQNAKLRGSPTSPLHGVVRRHERVSELGPQEAEVPLGVLNGAGTKQRHPLPVTYT